MYNYFLKSLTGGGLMVLYNRLMKGGNNWNFDLWDGGYFAGSVFSINAIKDMFLS